MCGALQLQAATFTQGRSVIGDSEMYKRKRGGGTCKLKNDFIGHSPGDMMQGGL
jgi:hypothetical protein